jgi:tRNA threonylcarbamoyladenosine biosynthesis protein TsaB
VNLLGIDTSSENLSFCIVKDGHTHFSLNRRLKFGASKLIQYIDKYFSQSPLKLKDIDAFILGAGPGSFTGLRISFAAVKALSLALNKPIITVGSFFACAYPLRNKCERLAVIADARRSLIYGATFKVLGGKLKREGKEELTDLKTFMKKCKDHLFISYDKDTRDAALAINPGIRFCPKDIYPDAKYLVSVGKDYFLKKRFVPLNRLEPLYLHPKTCQIRKR